ncbi:MAG: hypothetical protein KH345_13005 [Eubacterium sp.]|nr:hypothetical protein [Eubacterium sp.]
MKHKKVHGKDKVKKVKVIIEKIIGIGTIFCTLSGITALSIYNCVNSGIDDTEPNSIILFSEYSKITIYQETNMTATLNFETDSVSITAYLASGKVDTLVMSKKSSYEWQEKVIFNEVGTHKVVASAIDRNGIEITDTISIEVIPLSVDYENIFSDLLIM